MKAKAVFFDRDGVLNVDVAYLYKISDLQWIEGAREAVAYLTALGYKIFIVTNQSGIAAAITRWSRWTSCTIICYRKLLNAVAR